MHWKIYQSTMASNSPWDVFSSPNFSGGLILGKFLIFTYAHSLPILNHLITQFSVIFIHLGALNLNLICNHGIQSISKTLGDLSDIRREGNYLLHHWNYICSIYTKCHVNETWTEVQFQTNKSRDVGLDIDVDRERYKLEHVYMYFSPIVY